MKRFFLIIIVIILFIASGLIFWAGLSPKTFFTFFKPYPIVERISVRIGILDERGSEVGIVTESEPVQGKNGQVIVNNNTWTVEIVSEKAERERGLSNRSSLYNKKGMLFVFDEMDYQSFWMKDMLIPIDMVFFDENWVIVLIESNLQPNSFPKIFGDKIKSRYILEMNALEAEIAKLKVGDQAIFLNK